MENLTPPAAGHCKAAAGLICWPSWSSSGRRRRCRAQAAGGAVCCCMRLGRWGAGGAVCWRGDLVQVVQAVQGGGIIGAARGAGLLLAAVVIIGAAQAVQGAGGAASSGRPPTSSAARAKRKAQGGGAGGARVALGLCRRCWSAAVCGRATAGAFCRLPEGSDSPLYRVVL